VSDDWDEAWGVARRLAEEVTWLHQHHIEMTKLSGKAIEMASKASEFEGHAVKVYRDLMQALAGNAGRDRPVKLEDAVAAAMALLSTHKEKQA
jgi:hypothetical protein